MDLNRANSKLIRDAERQSVLAEFKIAKKEPLAIGSEAEVYEYDKTTLLKLYADSSRIAHLETLRKLYNSIDAGKSGLNLPQIHKIVQYGNLIAVTETRLDGEPLDTFLHDLEGVKLAQAETLYLDAVWRLKDIEIKKTPETYLLFDEKRISDASAQSFESFYASFLENKIARVGQFFQTLYPRFPEKAAALVNSIRAGNRSPLSLVHGDFFPGNVLVNKNLEKISGVIDFGSFTLFGNHLLDIAGAFGFYKMYYPDRKLIRKKILPKFLHRLEANERPSFFQFLLAHAILTSDLYAPDPDPRQDGHFQWAAEIVSEDEYWSSAL